MVFDISVRVVIDWGEAWQSLGSLGQVALTLSKTKKRTVSQQYAFEKSAKKLLSTKLALWQLKAARAAQTLHAASASVLRSSIAIAGGAA
ncbi:hypothetical protein [Paraburkholderia agricolaris]|uniref:hypothetical protein n=1 Tax=Paraburkholderia agricolaris TaxID=2152888 RepID=UPI001290C60B|nr:hypothetical protein [Paraburkholderia agricolaris]